MRKNGNQTKEQILDVAEDMVLAHGFGATSIDQILEQLTISKGAFFYHFKNKAALAIALVERYIERDEALLHQLVEKAERLSRDPLQQILILVGLLEDSLYNTEQQHSGCLVASFLYQFEEFDIDTKSAVKKGFDEWHRVLDEKFRAAIKEKSPLIKETPESLVDNLLSAFEGGLILAKMDTDPNILAKQISHFKNYIELLFAQIR